MELQQFLIQDSFNPMNEKSSELMEMLIYRIKSDVDMRNIKNLMEDLTGKSVSILIKTTIPKEEFSLFKYFILLLKKYMNKNEKKITKPFFMEIEANLKEMQEKIDLRLKRLMADVLDKETLIEAYESIDFLKNERVDLNEKKS